MKARHWGDDELIERLYGLGPADGHLEECGLCASRWRDLLASREQVLQPAPVSEELLVHQRDAVQQACGRPVRSYWWLPYAYASATAAVLLLAVLLYRPAPVPEPARVSSDTELLADVYSVLMRSEPLAAEPIHALFEVEQ